MKKFLYLLPIFIFALTLFGCDFSNSTSDTTTTSNYTITKEVETAVNEIQTSNSATSLNFYQDELDNDCLEIISHIRSFESTNLTSSEKENFIKEINYFVDNYESLQESYIELDAIETTIYIEIAPYYEYYTPLIEQLKIEYEILIARYPNYDSITEYDYTQAQKEYAQTQANAYAKKIKDEKYAREYCNKYGYNQSTLNNMLNNINKEYQSTLNSAKAKFEPIENAWNQRQEVENKYTKYLTAYNTLNNQINTTTQKYQVNYNYAKQTLELDRQNIFERMNKEN